MLVLLTLLVLLQSSNLWKNFSVDTASDTLLLYALSSLNFIAFVIFGFVFLRSIIKLARERRAFQLGSRIKTRLLIYFAAVSLLPIIAMAGFSYLFLNRALERWFTQIPENVVRQAREVQSRSLLEQTEKLRETARMLAVVIGTRDADAAYLSRVAEAGGLTRIEIVDAEGVVIRSAGRELAPEKQAELEKMLAYVRGGKLEEPLLQDGVGFDVASAELTGGRRLLIVPNSVSDETVSRMVDSSLAEFDRLKEKQVTVRQVGLLTLGVLTFLLIFASTWTAFYIARGLTVPIKALAEGAGAIARGELGTRVDVLAEDELELLVSAFNDMSAKLSENSAELNERRRYIETVLASLPNGVISFDTEDRITTINGAAAAIFGHDAPPAAGTRLDALVRSEDLATFEKLLARARRVGHWSEQAMLTKAADDGNTSRSLPAALTATSLAEGAGVVLVVEDLTELLTAQRAVAWREVARRMAHEIKNPLTPIQLSAERIAKRFGITANESNGHPSTTPSEISDASRKVVSDGTATILREVHSLKSMVDEFSRFARLPDAKPEPGNLNSVIRQAVELYDGRTDLDIVLSLEPSLPETRLDAEQIKRVFVNLIDNAIEAADGERKQSVTITTHHNTVRDLIVAEVADTGRGIDPADLQKLFQPYFSTKGRETGLGLAIVQRIVAEHNGKIKVVGNQPLGAKFIVELPASG